MYKLYIMYFQDGKTLELKARNNVEAIKFSLISILSSTISLGFKIVIAGEVYGQPLYGIGAMIQSEKVNFNTTAIFAWIIIIVIISSLLNLMEKIMLRSVFIWRR